MTFDAFAEMAQRREVRVFGRPYPLETRSYGLGLLGDAGEVADRITKIAGDVDGNVSLSFRRAHDAIMYELGDALWYNNAIAANSAIAWKKLCA